MHQLPQISPGNLAPAQAEAQSEMNVGVCRWDVRASPNRSLDANARPNGLIVINHELRSLARCCYILLESIAPVSDDPIIGRPAVAASS